MPLGFNLEAGSSGDILRRSLAWMKAGDLLRQDRFQASDGTWQKDEQELSLPIQMAMDGQIEVGGSRLHPACSTSRWQRSRSLSPSSPAKTISRRSASAWQRRTWPARI